MIYWTLFFEFFKIGLFAVGGGLATIPFLFDLTKRFNWFSTQDLVSMIALSESTPGPLGVNMATFAGFQAVGICGGFIATLGLVLPSLFVIVAISKVLNKFKESFIIKSVFYGLRPAVSVMILVFIFNVCKVIVDLTPNLRSLFLSGILFLCYLILIFRYKCHPIFFVLLGSFMGILLEL